MNLHKAIGLLWSRLRYAGGLGLRALAFSLLLLGAGSAFLLLPSPDEPQAPSAQAAAGWGGEALDVLAASSWQLSPVPLANACGLGASSCFRCHNGKRAAEPASDAVAAPWHLQHATVNYSCAGCHQGNPRILKQEIAHKGLLANPLDEPAKSCAGCHAAADVERLAATYRTTQSSTKTGK